MPRKAQTGCVLCGRHGVRCDAEHGARWVIRAMRCRGGGCAASQLVVRGNSSSSTREVRGARVHLPALDSLEVFAARDRSEGRPEYGLDWLVTLIHMGRLSTSLLPKHGV